ncbi:cell division protein FtsQ/DivIB [Aurantiacibacter gangjinensis]|uniref:Cell division protein FtsQ n=1 Tax=Aurantiacibacter gangjinensis TaxID=502682 RepID=A0A0G9MWS9_9SPHN|nr:cell division protein FtsQ/DivIB [Aurantiacibacter gangjinensis]APE27003.1 Cell division protein FtsQ [Aurantiacibacter gangjinensis]KLE33718.1 cell division protein FtsQ [Aurantiacibacter gangjinensis]
MARKNTRNTQGVRRQARKAGTSRKVRSARNTGQSILGRALGMLPFTEEQLQKTFTLLILGGAVAFAIFIANISGATAVASDRFADMASNAGYKLQGVTVQGTDRMNEMLVHERAFGQQNLAMTRVDTEALREDLLTLPWVQDARVSRQLPDRLVVDIIEREPHAVLRRADRLMLIDPTGVELEAISAAAAEDYLLIEGPGAQAQVEALETLLDAAPALKPRVKGAEYVGNRRWNLTFETDQRLALPEGEDRAAAALISFAQADGVHRLIGGEVVSFDMRNPPRMYMRVPGRAEAQELELQEEDG